MNNCININHPDVIKLSSELKLPPIVVAAKIGIWQEDNNNYEEFPTKDMLSTYLSKDNDAFIASTIFELNPNITENEIISIYNNYVNLMNKQREGKAMSFDTFKGLLSKYQVFKYKNTYIFGQYDEKTATFITRVNSSPTSKELLAEAIPNIVSKGIDFMSFVPKDYANKLVRSGYTSSINSYEYNFKGELMQKYAVASNPNVFKKIFNKSANEITSKEIEQFNDSLELKYKPVEIRSDLIEKAGKDLSKILEVYLSQFGIVIKDIDEIKDKLGIDELGFADLLSKIAYIKDKKDLPPIAGEFIAYMMQYNPLIQDIIKELSQTDNYKNLNKEQYFKIIGELISKDLQNKLEGNYSKSLIDKIKELINNFLNLFKTVPIDIININIGIISNNILQQNKKLITSSLYKPGSFGKQTKQVNIEDALETDKFGSSIIHKLSKQGFILTGSIALSEQGTILRPNENPLHDIDWVSPFSRKETGSKFLQSYPNAIKIRDIYGDNYVTDSYLIPPDGFNISNYKANDYNGKIIIDSYDIIDNEGNVVGTYRLQKREESNQNEEVVTGIEGKVIDFFTYNDYTKQEPYAPFTYYSEKGYTIQLANWKSIFKAKLAYARYKDIWDYNRFIPNDNTLRPIANNNDKVPNISFEEIERVSNMIVNKLEILGNNFRKRDFTKAKHEIFYRSNEFIKYNTAREIIENIFDSSTADKLDSRDTEKSLSDLLDSDLKGHFIEKLEKLKKAYPDEYEQSSVLETLQSDYRLIENFLKRNNLSEIDQYDETQQNTIKRVLNNLFDESKNYNFKSEKQKIAFLGNKALQRLESKIKSQIEQEKLSRFKLKSLIGKTETIINFLNIIPNYKELIKNKINNQIERVLFYKNKVISDKSTGIEKNILVRKLYDEASQFKKIDRLSKKAKIVNNDNILKYFPELSSNSEITLDLKTTLNRLIDNNSEYKDLALKLLSFSDSYSNLPIIITNNFKGIGSAAAYYNVDINNVVDKNTKEHLGIITNSTYIEVDISSDNFKAEPDRILLHEIIHSLTSIYLVSVDAKKDRYSPYKSLHAYIVKKLREFDASSNGILSFMNMPYGLKDEHELFAEALTNFEFQELLKQIPPIDEKKYRNVFEQIIDFIASIFSIDKYDSVYDQLEEVIYNTMNKQSSLNFTIEELLKSVNKDISDVEIMEDEQFKANQSTLSSEQIKDLQELKSKPEFKEGIEFVFNNNPELQDTIYESLGLDKALSDITLIKDREEAIKKYEELISKEVSGKPLINHLMLISSRNTGDIKNFANMIIELSESNRSLKELLDNSNLYAEHDSVGDHGRYVWNYKTKYSKNYISIEKAHFTQKFGNYDDVFLHELIHNLTTAAVIKESDQYNESFTKKIETLFDEFVSKQANKKTVDHDYADKVSVIISKLKDLLLFVQNAESIDIYNKFRTDDGYVKIKIDNITVISGKVAEVNKNSIKINVIIDKISELIDKYESTLNRINEGYIKSYYFLSFENKQDQLSEFLATFMSDESFRNELKLIPYKNSTFFDKIIEFIGDLLGLTKDDTLYNEFILTLSDFISNNDYSELAKQTPKVALENELNDIKAQKQQALDTYADYVAKISLGIIKNPTTGKYNDSKVKDIVYHDGLKGIKEYLKEFISNNTDNNEILADNGKPSILYKTLSKLIGIVHGINNEDDVMKLYKKTKTPEFKKWFEGSKLVDENDEPIVYFHTGKKDLNEFNPNVVGKFTHTFFSRFILKNLRIYDDGQDIYPVFIKSTNIKDIHNFGLLMDYTTNWKYLKPNLEQDYDTIRSFKEYGDNLFDYLIKNNLPLTFDENDIPFKTDYDTIGNYSEIIESGEIAVPKKYSNNIKSIFNDNKWSDSTNIYAEVISENKPLYREDTTLKERLFDGEDSINSVIALEKIIKSDHPLSKLASYLYTLPDIKRLKQINIRLIDKNSEEYIKLTNEKLKQYGEDTNWKNFKGWYDSEKEEIVIVANAVFKNGKSESTILHEIIHALTTYKINSYYFQEWNDVYNYVKKELKKYKHLDVDNMYAMSDPHELMTAIFTNSDFINLLMHIPGKQDKSLFQEIIDFFKDLFKIKDSTLFDEVMSQALNLINDKKINEQYLSKEGKHNQELRTYFNNLSSHPAEFEDNEQMQKLVNNDVIMNHINGNIDDYKELYDSQKVKPLSAPFISYKYKPLSLKKDLNIDTDIDKRVYKNKEFEKLFNLVNKKNKDVGYIKYGIIKRIDDNYVIIENKLDKSIDDIKKDILKSKYKDDGRDLNTPWYYYAKEIMDKNIIFKHKDIYFSLRKDAFIYMMENNIEPEYTQKVKEKFAKDIKINTTDFELISDIPNINNTYLKIVNKEPVFIPDYRGLYISKNIPLVFYKNGNQLNINKKGTPVLINSTDIEVDTNGIVKNKNLEVLNLNDNKIIINERLKSEPDYYINNLFKELNISSYLTINEAEDVKFKLQLKLNRDKQNYDIDFVKNSDYIKIKLTMNNDNIINPDINFNPIMIDKLLNMNINPYLMPQDYLKSIYELTTDELNNDLTCKI